MHPAVYILASQRNGTLYIGVTSHLVQRIWQHKNDLVPGFTEKFGVHDLVYFELLDDMANAWKLALIEKQNPTWQDLWPTIL